VLCLVWVVAFDHGQVDAGVVADLPGRARQAGTGLCVMGGGDAGHDRHVERSREGCALRN
jgi:hypothetical protein